MQLSNIKKQLADIQTKVASKQPPRPSLVIHTQEPDYQSIVNQLKTYLEREAYPDEFHCICLFTTPDFRDFLTDSSDYLSVDNSAFDQACEDRTALNKRLFSEAIAAAEYAPDPYDRGVYVKTRSDVLT